jgi:predicted GIY-YIG superfamily endonuclease
MPARTYYTYIMSSRTRVIYIGITSNLELRVQQHKQNQHDGFTKEYRCHHLGLVRALRDRRIRHRERKTIKRLETSPETSPHRPAKPGMARPEQRLGQKLPERIADQPSHHANVMKGNGVGYLDRCHPERSAAKSKDPHEQSSCESLQGNDGHSPVKNLGQRNKGRLQEYISAGCPISILRCG